MKDLQDDMYKAKHEALLIFIKENNPNIVYGVVFNITEGRKHLLWCGSYERPMFRISLKKKALP